jgi:hypothetical protein
MEAARPLTKEAEVANIITTLAETRLMSPKDTKEEKQYYITNIIMGIKSFFSGLFDKSDNQMPSSLGNGKEVNPNYNLGSKSTLSVDEDPVPSQKTEKSDQKKNFQKKGKHGKKNKKKIILRKRNLRLSQKRTT